MRQTIARGEGAELARLDPIQPATDRPHPKRSFAILKQTAHRILRQTFLGRQGSEVTVAKAAQSAFRRPDPQIAVSCLAQLPDDAEQLSGLFRINNYSL